MLGVGNAAFVALGNRCRDLTFKESVARYVAAISEVNLTLALDYGAWAAEPLAALLADKVGGTERVVELRLGKDAVATDAAAKPRGERLLVGEAAGVHRTEFRREQLGVAAPDAKYDQRAGVAEHRGADGRRELIGVLVRETEMRCELARLGEKRGECFRAEGLEFVHVHEERDAPLGRQRSPLHRDELHMRDEKRPE